MPRAKQGGKAKKRAKRNSKSVTEDTVESESMEQTETSADQPSASQQSEDLNESKVSCQLNDTETSEQLDSSIVSDNATQDSEMTDDNQDYQSGKNTQENDNATDKRGSSNSGQKQVHNTESSSKSDRSMNEGDFTNNKDSMEKSKMSPEKLLQLESNENKFEKKVEEEPVISFKPHTFPFVSCSSLLEKWEWHISIYPIDQADIRNCVLNSAAKLAEETWFHIEKKNNGMGVYDLCAKNVTDATSVMLKITQTPMTYRYVTVQVTRRSPSKAMIDELKETVSENEESDLQNEIDKLPKTEIEETAVLLLDFMHIQSFDSKEGKEKKRSLFVKYLPEGTTKELLNVLFPLANNLDIIKTGKGRSDGDLNVAETNNIIAYCKTYVAISIGAQNVFLDWKEESIEDGSEIFDATEESPFEILPKKNEILYGTVQEMEEDETVQYLKRKRDIEIEQRRLRMEARFDGNNRPKHDKGRMKGDMNRGKSEGIRPLMEGLGVEKREKRSRWDKDVGPSLGAELLKRQMAMNEKIQSQLALLQSASIGAIPSLLDVPLLQGSRSRKDRKRDRFERDRKTSESNRSDNSRQSREKNVAKKDKSGDRKNSTDDRPEQPPRGGRFENKTRGGHFGGGNRFDENRGRGGRFNDDRFGGRGGRFPGPNRGGHFDNFGRDAGPPSDVPGRAGMPPRGGPFEPPGRLDAPGRGGHFGRGGRFDGKGRGGNFEPPGRGAHFDSSRRGGHFEQGGRGGFFDSPRRGGHFDSAPRGGHFDSAPRGGHFDSAPRGGHFDSAGRGGHFEPTGRGGRFDNQARGGGRFDNQGRGGYFERQGRGGGRVDGQGRGGARGGAREDNRGRGTGGFDNRNKGKNFEARGNDQFSQPPTNTFDQQNYGSQNYGNPPSYNYNNQQTGYDNQTGYNSTQPGFNTQMPYNQQNPYTQGSYGTQQTAVATNQPADYTTQQTAQTGYTAQAAQPVSYPTQTNMYGTQQTGYDQNAWAQQAYTAQQQTGYTTATATGNESYWGQPADYTAQATTAVGQQQDYSQAYAQQATAANPAAGYAYNTQNVSGTEYTADAATAAAYANQGYYSTGQQATAGVQDATYGAYSTQDSSVYGQTAQPTLTTAYNFAQYPSSSS